MESGGSTKHKRNNQLLGRTGGVGAQGISRDQQVTWWGQEGRPVASTVFLSRRRWLGCSEAAPAAGGPGAGAGIEFCQPWWNGMTMEGLL